MSKLLTDEERTPSFLRAEPDGLVGALVGAAIAPEAEHEHGQKASLLGALVVGAKVGARVEDDQLLCLNFLLLESHLIFLQHCQH